MGQVTAYIGLGSNMGDRAGVLSEAVKKLSETPGIRVTRQSAVIETKPVGPIQDQADFLNSVVAVETDLSALDLLDVLLSIERGLGRIRDQRWGPRTIDLDLLLYGTQSITHPRLKIPHPEIANRPFVRAGLAEVGAFL